MKDSKQKKVILLEKKEIWTQMDIIDVIAFSIIKRISDKEMHLQPNFKNGERDGHDIPCQKLLDIIDLLHN